MISRSRTFSGLVPALLLSVSAGGCDRSAGTPAPGPGTAPAPSPSEPSSPKPPVEHGQDRAEAEAEAEAEANVDVEGDDDPAAKCGDEVCTPPYACVEYYGIAGASGPKFQSCEVRCKGPDDASCPAGTRCTAVADGPGQVCR